MLPQHILPYLEEVQFLNKFKLNQFSVAMIFLGLMWFLWCSMWKDILVNTNQVDSGNAFFDAKQQQKPKQQKQRKITRKGNHTRLKEIQEMLAS